MNAEQIAFFNHQLAGMLRTGIPLEAALAQLCQGLKRGRWRDEMEALRGDLSHGVPLDQALERRQLPPIYTQLVRVGAGSNDLPATLTMAADYFTEQHQFWNRFRAAMFYPALVLVMAIAVCLLLIVIQQIARELFLESITGSGASAHASLAWIGPALLLLVLTVVLVAPLVPRIRFAARWHAPGWKEGTLSQLASSLALLLKGGASFPQALGLLAQLEPYKKARQEFERWGSRLAEGQSRFAQIVQGTRLLPPLFVWLVAGSGEDLPAGFGRAAELYRARAQYRLNLFLFALLPASVIVLGILLLAALAPLFVSLTEWLDLLGGPWE